MSRVESNAMRRAVAISLVLAVLVLGGPPAWAGSGETVEVLADAGARSFALRPSYDSGGQTPLNFYLGYAESNLSTPEPQADGQASWYNLGIAETAAFSPPEDCTPEKNLGATVGDDRNGTVQDLGAWLDAYRREAAGALGAGEEPPPPDVPSFRHACTERFAGFSQSRYPATHRCGDDRCSGIKQQERDDLLTKPLCKDAFACTAREALAAASGPALTDGSFESEATSDPSNRSAAVMTRLGDGALVSVASATMRSITSLKGDDLVAEAETVLHNVCVGRAAGGCALHIDEVRSIAVVRLKPGRAPVRTQRSTAAGVRRAGSQTEEDLMVLDAGILRGCCYDSRNGQFRLDTASETGDCTPVQGAGSYAIADAGGLRIFGKGASGGGILIGGACVRARIGTVRFADVVAPVPGPVPPVPPSRVVVTDPLPRCAECGGDPIVMVGPPRIVTRELVSHRTRQALAWRTAGTWGPALLALTMLVAVAWLFRRKPVMQPVIRRIDRFGRQFLKG